MANCFTADRKANVVVGGYSSDPYTIGAGVPQGSILGPTLFLPYVRVLGTVAYASRPRVQIYSFAYTSRSILELGLCLASQHHP